MIFRRFIGRLFCIMGLCGSVAGQDPPFCFHHLTIEDGLNDGHIQLVGQDKFGYIWFGSLGGLNRYDGKHIRTYAYRAGDTTSLLSGIAFSMATDESGSLFFGFENGLAVFDYLKNSFRRIKALDGVPVYRMIPHGKEALYLMTGKGLVKYNPLTWQAKFYNKTDPLLKSVAEEGVLKGDKLYLGTFDGIVVFDALAEKSYKLPVLHDLRISALCFDDQNRLWATAFNMPKVFRLSADLTTFENYDSQLTPFDPALSRQYFIAKDKKGRIWLSTKHIGLLQYVPETNGFVRHIKDEQKPWTPSTNVHLSIFCDKDGMIWLGSAEGVNFFHPDKNLFETILPFDKDLDVRNRLQARVATEDKDKNLWFATPDGVVQYDVKTRRYRNWRNEPDKPPVIPYNSIRHVFCDDENRVWVITSKGLSRYNPKKDKMELLTSKDGFPDLGYMRMYKDRDGMFWFSTQDPENGYHVYDPVNKTLKGISQYPHLQRFAHMSGWCFLHDSKGRYWFGSLEEGLGMYDPATRQSFHWRSEGPNAIAGDIVMDIREDRDGLIWIATNHGVTRIDCGKSEFATFNTDNGLNSNSTSSLAIDALNRVWIGTGNGLTMLDSSRRGMTHFNRHNGLPSAAFTDFPAFITAEGHVIMGTQKGFIRFDPLQYVDENRKLDCYIDAYVLDNVEHSLYPVDEKTPARVEFEAGENAFSLKLVALNYFNPSQTWYAYKLDGFDDNWHITQDHKVVYTNLPGGKYVFRYKASLSANDWNVPEKSLPIYIETAFYKTFWFWGLAASIIGIPWFLYYRSRQIQQRRVADLQNKAQRLEKEKVVMQYEGLKQQLNPHFLFNSLTSLGSLIDIDTRQANTFLENLSKTYRYILKSSESETVLLSEEIKFAENFIMLQKTRFEEGLIVNFNINEDAWRYRIVPVTLQNLIENAIKHNVIDLEEPLIVDIYTESNPEKGGYFLLVRNNLQKKSFVATSNKRGLINFVSLYQYLTAVPVDISETDRFFTVKIPLL